MSIKIKFPLFITFLVLFASGIVFFIMFSLYMKEIEREVIKRGKVLSKTLADVDISVFLGRGDLASNDRILYSKLEKAIKEEDVEKAAYYTQDKRVIYEKNNAPLKLDSISHLEFLYPIKLKRKTVGYGYIKLKEEVMINAKREAIEKIKTSGVFITVLSLFISILVSILLTRPIIKLTVTAKELGKGKLNTRVRISSKDEIGVLAKTFNKMAERIQTLFMRLKEKHRYTQKLLKEVTEDGLTGLFVYKHFMKILEGSVELAKKYRYPISLIMLDIDDFKKINDTYGHEKGNEVLKRVAKVLSEEVRKDKDVVGRYGGEEFCVLLEDTEKDTALEIAERLRKGVEEEFAQELGVTISAGVTTSKNSYNVKEIIETADKALYSSKREGKNRVSFIPL